MSYRERFLVATDNVKLEEIPVYILGVGAKWDRDWETSHTHM